MTSCWHRPRFTEVGHWLRGVAAKYLQKDVTAADSRIKFQVSSRTLVAAVPSQSALLAVFIAKWGISERHWRRIIHEHQNRYEGKEKPCIMYLMFP